jgi:hypothetical protein
VKRTSDSATTTASGTVAVAEHDALTGTGTTLTENLLFNNVPLASFTDSDLVTPASDLFATINWGDGTTTTGVVSGSNGSFSVAGSHDYAAPGAETVQVTLADDTPGTALAIATTTLNVGVLLGDANGNGVQDTGETTLFVPGAAAQELLNASSSNPDLRVSMMKQALEAQINIDHGNGDPGSLSAGHDLITDAVAWLRGLAPFTYAPVGGNVDLNHDGILESGATSAGNDYNTTTQMFTTPGVKSTMAAGLQYVDAVNSPPQTGDIMINGQDLVNALAAYNTNKLVIASAQVGWDASGMAGGTLSDQHSNTASGFLAVLKDNHVISGPTHA